MEEGKEKLCGDVEFQCEKFKTSIKIPFSRRVYPTGVLVFALSFLMLFLVPPPFAVASIAVWGAFVVRWVLRPLVLEDKTAASFGD